MSAPLREQLQSAWDLWVSIGRFMRRRGARPVEGIVQRPGSYEVFEISTPAFDELYALLDRYREKPRRSTSRDHFGFVLSVYDRGATPPKEKGARKRFASQDAVKFWGSISGQRGVRSAPRVEVTRSLRYTAPKYRFAAMKEFALSVCEARADEGIYPYGGEHRGLSETGYICGVLSNPFEFRLLAGRLRETAGEVWGEPEPREHERDQVGFYDASEDAYPEGVRAGLIEFPAPVWGRLGTVDTVKLIAPREWFDVAAPSSVFEVPPPILEEVMSESTSAASAGGRGSLEVSANFEDREDGSPVSFPLLLPLVLGALFVMGVPIGIVLGALTLARVKKRRIRR